MPTPRLQRVNTALLVVDMQERLVPAIHDSEQVVRQVACLIDGAKALDVPILVTEQYRKGLGATVPELEKRLDAAVCRPEKMTFSACIEPIRQTLADCGARSVLVCGIEAHVCVLQSCLDLLDLGYITAVAEDAIGSRRPRDSNPAVRRMTQSGVLPTTVEAALFELVHEAGSEKFKAILPLVK